MRHIRITLKGGTTRTGTTTYGIEQIKSYCFRHYFPDTQSHKREEKQCIKVEVLEDNEWITIAEDKE